MLISDLLIDSISGEILSELHPAFTVSLDGAAIDLEKVKVAVPCMQDFVRHPLFTQRNFFCETGISMLNTAVAAADAVRHSSEFDAWVSNWCRGSPRTYRS